MTKQFNSFKFNDDLDKYGDLYFEAVDENGLKSNFYIDKNEAIKIVNHLNKVFKIGDI